MHKYLFRYVYYYGQCYHDKSENSYLWRYDSSGLFSVETAYHVFSMSAYANQLDQQSDPSRMKALWNTVWEMPIRGNVSCWTRFTAVRILKHMFIYLRNVSGPHLIENNTLI